jgi:hypothetical protein
VCKLSLWEPLTCPCLLAQLEMDFMNTPPHGEATPPFNSAGALLAFSLLSTLFYLDVYRLCDLDQHHFRLRDTN